MFLGCLFLKQLNNELIKRKHGYGADIQTKMKKPGNKKGYQKRKE